MCSLFQRTEDKTCGHLDFFHLFSSYAKIIISFYLLFWYAALKCVFDMCECECWGWI